MTLERVGPFALVLAFLMFLDAGCAHRKTPLLLDKPPERPYEVIAEVETHTDWGMFQGIWFWWHYMPWYSPIHKIHEEKLIKKARRLNADAVINVKQYPKRSGARADAIRFV